MRSKVTGFYGMILGQGHCLALPGPTLDLCLEIIKSRKFVIQGFVWITKFQSQVPTLLQAKVAQHGKQMRVGACKGFWYNSVKLGLLANGSRYEVDSNTVKAPNFGPHGHLGPLFQKDLLSLQRVLQKNEENTSFRKTLDLQNRFCSFFVHDSSTEAIERARKSPKFPWGPKLEPLTVRFSKW
jgi:hypothetical protein